MVTNFVNPPTHFIALEKGETERILSEREHKRRAALAAFGLSDIQISGLLLDQIVSQPAISCR